MKKFKVDKEQRQHYCNSFQTWVRLMTEREEDVDSSDDTRQFATAAWTIELAVHKSCLLDRMIYGGEYPSKTPCPVHKGRWSGCHGPWPGDKGTTIRNGEPETIELQPSRQCQEWYDQGCRCFQHSCGCTTGWQPDEHCGCLESDDDEKHSAGVKVVVLSDDNIIYPK